MEGSVDEAQFQIGRTMIFLRAGCAEALEDARLRCDCVSERKWVCE